MFFKFKKSKLFAQISLLDPRIEFIFDTLILETGRRFHKRSQSTVENVIGDLFGSEIRSALQSIELELDFNSTNENITTTATIRLIVPQQENNILHHHHQQQQKQIIRPTNDRMWYFQNNTVVAQWPALTELLQSRFTSSTTLFPFAVVFITTTTTTLSSTSSSDSIVRERIVDQLRNQLFSSTNRLAGVNIRIFYFVIVALYFFI